MEYSSPNASIHQPNTPPRILHPEYSSRTVIELHQFTKPNGGTIGPSATHAPVIIKLSSTSARAISTPSGHVWVGKNTKNTFASQARGGNMRFSNQRQFRGRASLNKRVLICEPLRPQQKLLTLFRTLGDRGIVQQSVTKQTRQKTGRARRKFATGTPHNRTARSEGADRQDSQCFEHSRTKKVESCFGAFIQEYSMAQTRAVQHQLRNPASTGSSNENRRTQRR